MLWESIESCFTTVSKQTHSMNIFPREPQWALMFELFLPIYLIERQRYWLTEMYSHSDQWEASVIVTWSGLTNQRPEWQHQPDSLQRLSWMQSVSQPGVMALLFPCTHKYPSQQDKLHSSLSLLSWNIVFRYKLNLELLDIIPFIFRTVSLAGSARRWLGTDWTLIRWW